MGAESTQVVSLRGRMTAERWQNAETARLEQVIAQHGVAGMIDAVTLAKMCRDLMNQDEARE